MILVGKIVNTFGIKGELKVMSESEFLEERFKVGNKVYFNETEEHTIDRFRMHKGFAMIGIDGLKNINDVEQFVNCKVYVDRDDIEEKDDSLYLFDLMDLDVYEGDEYLGKVIDVDKQYQTILKVEKDGKTFMIPFVDAFIKQVDTDAGRIDVELIEGII